MAIFSWRQTGLGDLTDNAEERLRGDMRVLECRIGRIEAAMFNWRAGAPEPPAGPAGQPGLIVDPLVWRVLDKRLRWIAVDADDQRWAYQLKPKTGGAIWENAPGGDYQIIGAIAPGLIRVTGDWREAIAERPEGM